MDKLCLRCEVERGQEFFGIDRSQDDNLTRWCKRCLAAYRIERRLELGKGKPADWKKKTVDIAAYRKQWIESHPGYHTKKKNEWYKKNPERAKVKQALRYALKMGKIARLPCMVCGEKSEAHHPDYSKPLDVVWLCKEHHREVHFS